MKLGIMGAVPEEIDLIRELMTDIQVAELGGRNYYQGKIHGVEVVLVFSRWGKVAAATTASMLIAHFNIDKLVFTGVAGATSLGLNIGDIVISSELYQHDLDDRPFFAKHEVPLTGVTLFSADKSLVKKAEVSAQKLLENIDSYLSSSVLAEFAITNPKCLLGTIASGDLFVSSDEQTATILSERPDTLAVEMEGAAVAQVCYDYAIPYVVVRTISDRADHAAPINFPKFTAEVARFYSKQIIDHLLLQLV